MKNHYLLKSFAQVLVLVSTVVALFSVPLHAQTIKREPTAAGVQVDHKSGKNIETVKLKSAEIKLVTRSLGVHEVEESYVMIDGKKKVELSQHLGFIDVYPSRDIVVIKESGPASGCYVNYHIVYRNSENNFRIKSFDNSCELNAVQYSPKKVKLFFKQYSAKTKDYQPVTGVLVLD